MVVLFTVMIVMVMVVRHVVGFRRFVDCRAPAAVLFARCVLPITFPNPFWVRSFYPLRS